MTRPIIGARYVRHRYERRASDGRFECLRPQLSDEELTLQTALSFRRHKRVRNWVIVMASVGAGLLIKFLMP